MLLRDLSRTATLPSGNDATVYGQSRASPHAFFPHHAAAISAAAVNADARTVLVAAADRCARLARATPAAPPRAVGA